MHSSAVVTQLLLDWTPGNELARDQMLSLVYDELRRVARAFLAGGGFSSITRAAARRTSAAATASACRSAWRTSVKPPPWI
jgi:hypothetical protein